MKLLGTIGAILVALLAIGVSPAYAEPTTPATSIKQIRPYLGANSVLVTLTSVSVCNTDTYSIDLSLTAGKEAYAAALAALLADKQVMIEVNNATGCTGYGTHIQSIYILN